MAISGTGVVGVTALIYHLGTPVRQSWVRSLPGAVVAIRVPGDAFGAGFK